MKMENQDSERYMSVGELAKRMKVTVRTLQYYDKTGLLCPSKESEGGRRLYSDKDMVKLHQILSLKYLGFTLDDIKNRVSKLENPSEVKTLLQEQAHLVQQKISEFTDALSTIVKLNEEIAQMNAVDFKKIADIVMLLKSKNECYWAVKYFDDGLMNHVANHFDGKSGAVIIDQWKMLCDEAAKLEKQGNLPESEEGQKIAALWWQMLLEFTKGDLTLLPKLREFAKDREGWDQDWRSRQDQAENYVNKALEFYLQNTDVDFFKQNKEECD